MFWFLGALALAGRYMGHPSALPIFLILAVAILVYPHSRGSTLTLFIAAFIVLTNLRVELFTMGALAWCTGLAVFLIGVGWPARRERIIQLPLWATLLLAAVAIAGSIVLMPAVGAFLGVILAVHAAGWILRENMKGRCPSCRQVISVAAVYRRCPKCGNPFVILDDRWLTVGQAMEEVPILPTEIANGLAWTVETQEGQWRKETQWEVMRSSKPDCLWSRRTVEKEFNFNLGR